VTGTIVNAFSIVIAGSIGLLFRKGISDTVIRTMQDGLGLLVLVIGLQYGFKGESLPVIGLSIALGAVIGEWRAWEGRLEKLGEWMQKKIAHGDSQFSKGFISATLVFCVGAMAVLGALEDGLTDHYDILLLKSMLDGISALIFAASMGAGVLFSAIPVLLYQGAITLCAGFLQPFFTDALLNNMTALGGVLIAGIGTNIIGITRIRVANLLPGLLILPFIMILFQHLPL